MPAWLRYAPWRRPALPRGEEQLGERHQRVHVGIGGVSGAGDRTAVSRLLGTGGQHTGCGAAAGRGSVRQAETNRRR